MPDRAVSARNYRSLNHVCDAGPLCRLRSEIMSSMESPGVSEDLMTVFYASFWQTSWTPPSIDQFLSKQGKSANLVDYFCFNTDQTSEHEVEPCFFANPYSLLFGAEYRSYQKETGQSPLSELDRRMHGLSLMRVVQGARLISVPEKTEDASRELGCESIARRPMLVLSFIATAGSSA